MGKYYKSANYRVEIDGISVASYHKCSIGDLSFPEIVYKEGGGKTYKDYGQPQYGDITLSKASGKENMLYEEWVKPTIDGDDSKAIKDFSIVQTESDGSEVARINVYEGRVKTYKPGEFDAESESFRIEEIVVSSERWEII